MNKYVALAEKIRSMTAKEIVLTMVESLKYPVTDRVDMGTFGRISNGVCYGCAATNLICKIGMLNPKTEFINDDPLGYGGMMYSYQLSNDEAKVRQAKDVIGYFEHAIDELRKACIGTYNHYAELGKFARIEILPDGSLYPLDTYNYRDKLKYYEEFAEKL